MLVKQLLANKGLVSLCLRRNFGASTVVLQQASDPIQKLFVDKVREYGKKSKAAGGKLVDATPALEKELAAELERVAKIYGGAPGVDMTKFPSVQFQEPKLDPIDQSAAAK